MTFAPFLPGHLYAKQNFTAGARALASPTLAPPLHMGCWGGTTQNLGWIVPQLGAERPRLGRTWGGSTEGWIDQYPNFRSRERKFRELSLPGTFVPGSESSQLILLNEYYDDDDAYYTEHRQRQRRSALSKHNSC